MHTCFAEIFCVPGCSLKRREAAGARALQLLVPACRAGRAMGGKFGGVNL